MNIKEQINKIVNELLSYEPERIILYGSAARNEMTDESDVDLLIIKKTDRRFIDRIGDVLNVLKTYTLPIEPIVLTPAEFDKMVKEKRVFAENILKEGKILYEK